MGLNEQALRAQAECLQAKGWDETADAVELGWVEFDPGALECMEERER
jgi:hypothetical protein